MVLAEKIPERLVRRDPDLPRKLVAREARDLPGLDWRATLRDEWLTVQAQGDDSEAFLNLLRRKYSEAPVGRSRIEKWDVLRGFVTGSGRIGYGVYIDVGLLEPARKDALYPLHAMRAQLEDGVAKSAREILTDNAIVDYFPLTVVVTGMDGEKVTVQLDEQFREELVSWQGYPFDRVVMVGLTSDQALNVVRQSRLGRDVVKVGSLALLVQCLVLKVGTDAPGIISKIGRRLPGVSLAAYRSRVKI